MLRIGWFFSRTSEPFNPRYQWWYYEQAADALVDGVGPHVKLIERLGEPGAPQRVLWEYDATEIIQIAREVLEWDPQLHAHGDPDPDVWDRNNAVLESLLWAGKELYV
jgi:hypothetical protein